MNFFLTFSFLLFTTTSVDAKIYECSQDCPTFYLPTDEIAFFSSSLNERNKNQYCCIYFILNDTYAAENVIAHIAERKFDVLYYPINLWFSNKTTLHLGNKLYEEGYMIFEDWGNITNHCPLESISREDPFEFTDESQVLYLINGYNGTKKINHPCKWKFTAPINYGFKIVIEIFEADENTRLIIENRTEILVNEKSVTLFHPIYNSDTHIQIYLVNTNPNLTFRAYISIVKSNVTKEVGNCITTINTAAGITTWGNWNLRKMYGNNQKCFFKLTIFPKTMVDVTTPYIAMGDIRADYVGFYDEDGHFVEIGIKEGSYNFFFNPYKNETAKNVSFEFVSDGSVPGFGFQLKFETIKCECGKKTVPCGYKKYIMDNHIVYCRNMHCEFILEPCSSPLTLLVVTIPQDAIISSPDYFQVFSNNLSVYYITYSNFKHSAYPVYLNSSSINTLEATTFDSKRFSFKTYSVNATTISARIMLTPDNPSYIIDSKLHPLILIEISDELKPYNYAFEIHRYYNYDQAGTILYTDESLSQTLTESSCNFDNDISDFYTCTVLNYKTFVVYSFDTNLIYPYAVIQALNANKKCFFDKTIFHQNSFRTCYGISSYGIPLDLTISAIARPDAPCLLSFLLEISVYYVPTINNVWTTAKNENVKIFAGINHNQSVFEFNSSSQNYWKNIILSSPIYTIEIPNNSSAIIIISSVSLTEGVDFDDIYYMNITEFPYYSMVTTQCFGISTSHFWPLKLTQYFNIGNEYAVKFTAKYLNLSKLDSVRLNSNSKYYSFKKIGDFYYFRNQTLVFEYNLAASENFNIGAFIMIEAVNDTNI